MKIVKYLIWLIVIISCAVSLAFYSVVVLVCVIRLFYRTDDVEIMAIAAIPMLVYCWIMWTHKESINLINKVKK